MMSGEFRAKTAEELEAEREVVGRLLEESHDALQEVEANLRRIENMGHGTTEISHSRIRLREAMLHMKDSGHAGRWGE